MELHRLTRHCYYSDPIQEGDQPVMGLIAGACETLAVDNRAGGCGCSSRRKSWGCLRCAGWC